MPSVAGVLRRVYNTFNKRLVRATISLFEDSQPMGLRLVTLGDGGGAWIVPIDLIRPGALCYCVGVGLDASLDADLAAKCRARVYSFDPTPRAIAYMEELGSERRGIDFAPIGIWSSDTQLKFYAPMNKLHPNYSVQDIHRTADYFTAECRRLSTVMAGHGHTHLDLLKLDIEGAWFEVVSNIVAENVLPSILCVEFDSPTSLVKVLKTVRKLREAGMVLVHRDRDNYLFVDRRAVPTAAGGTLPNA